MASPVPNALGYIVLAAFGVGVLYAVTAGAESGGQGQPRGLPESKQLRVHTWSQGMPVLANYNGVAYEFEGRFVQSTDPEHARRFSEYLQATLAPRKAELPSDATLHAGDRYSGQAYWVPVYHAGYQAGGFVSPASVTQIVIDEYGRVYDLDYSQSGMLANLWGNPLFQVALAAALLASGYGVPAYAAIQAYQMRGRDLSLKNLAITAARAYVVSQCGEACGAAFDFGVGVASGQSVDEAAVDVALNQMTPEQRAQYEAGKQAAQNAGLV